MRYSVRDKVFRLTAVKKTLLTISVIGIVFLSMNVKAQERLQKIDPIMMMPDLTANFVDTLSPKPPAKAKVKNIGNKEANNFYVDFFLSTHRLFSENRPMYLNTYHNDVSIKEGRRFIKSLSPGQSIIIPAPFPIKMDKNPDTKDIYLGVAVDITNAVKESNEKNNIDWIKLKSFYFYPATINSTGQLGYMHPASIGEMVLTISGSGYGTDFTNKNVFLGPHALAIQVLESSSTYVQSVIPSNVTFGQTYDVYYTENGVRISNIKQHLLKVYIVSCGRVVGSIIEPEGPAGCTVQISGAYFGAAQGSFVVHFGPTTAAVTSWTNTSVDIICPSLPPGYYPIYFEKNGQDVTLSHGGFTIQ